LHLYFNGVVRTPQFTKLALRALFHVGGRRIAFKVSDVNPAGAKLYAYPAFLASFRVYQYSAHLINSMYRFIHPTPKDTR
jgi:hypothetical protein